MVNSLKRLLFHAMNLNPTGCYAIRILRLLYIEGELKNDDKKNHHDHLLVDRVRNNNLCSYLHCRLKDS